MILLIVNLCHMDDDFLKRQEASEYLNNPNQAYNLNSITFSNNKEKRREAKESYEEKCERSVLVASSKPKWCPDLEEFDFLFFLFLQKFLLYTYICNQ